MAAMQWTKKGVNPKSSNGAMVSSGYKTQAIPEPSYFISIGIPQPNTRIKIPKLLEKTMHIGRRRSRRNLQKCNGVEEFENHENYSNNKKKLKYGAKPRRFFPRKIRLMFSSIRKLYGGNWNRVLKEEEEEEEEEEELKEARPEPSSSSLSRSLKEIMEMEDEVGKKKSSRPLLVVGKQYLRLPPSFLRTFNMKTGVIFIKGKIYRCSRRASSVFKREENLGNQGKRAFAWRPNRSCRKLRMAGPMGKKVSKQVEEEEEEEEEELCKKRVLLGKRCKPLLL